MPENNSSSPAANALASISGTPALVPIGPLAGQPIFPLDRLCLLAGASQNCELRLAVEGISAFHTLIVTYPGGVFLRSLAATNPVWVNGRVVREHRLTDGDQIQFGPCPFQFVANGARFEQPQAVPPSAIEAGPAGAKLITEFSVLIGRQPGCDVQVLDPIVEECHAVLFAANGKWHIRDLNTQTGTRVNDARVLQKELVWGDRLGIGSHPLRLMAVEIDPSAAPPAPPQLQSSAPPQAPAAGPGGDMFLGGMPVQLPEVSAPQGFGKINVSFQGKSIYSQMDPRAKSELSAETVLQNIAAADAARATTTSSDDPSQPRLPVLRNFPPVPKIKRMAPEEPEEGKSAGSDDDTAEAPPGSSTLWDEYANVTMPLAGEFGAGPEPFAFVASPQPLPTSDLFPHASSHQNDLNEAAFGGQPLGPSAGGATDGAMESNWQEPGAEDFSADKFWDETGDDSAEVPLPHRERDLSPPIPPSGTTATSLGGLVGAAVDGDSDVADLTETGRDDVFSGGASEPGGNGRSHAEESTATRIAPPREPVNGDRPPAAQPRAARSDKPIVPTYAAASSNRSRHRPRTGLRVAVALISMAAAVGAVYALVPSQGVVEDRLEFIKTPAQGTPAWQAFEAEQLRRLADPTIRDLAAQKLTQDYPSDAPGLLQGDPGPFNQLTSEARFVPAAAGSDLVLRLSGADPVEDGQRLTALMKSLYIRDADLSKAADAARQSLADWDSRLAAKQKDLDELTAQMKLQRDQISAAAGLSEQLAPLQAAADSAGKDYADKQQTALRDSRALQNLRASLRAVASTQPVSDPQADDLERQIKNLAADITNLQSGQAVADAATSRANLDAAQKDLQDALDAAKDALQAHPDIAEPVQSARELLLHVRAMVDQVSERRRQSQGKYEELKRFIEQTNRRRQQIAYDADAKLNDMAEQLNDVERQAEIQEEAASAQISAPRPTSEPSTEPVSDDALMQPPPETQPSAGDQLDQLRQTADELRRQMSVRRRELWQDASAGVRERLSRVLDTGWAQLGAEQQLITGTLQTVIARLSASPPIGGVSNADRKTLTNVLTKLFALIKAQSADGEAAIAQSDPQYQAMLGLEDQRDDLQDRAAARREAVAATTRPVDESDHAGLFTSRDETAARLATEIAAMNAAGDKFIDAAMKSTQVALSLQNAAKAQGTLAALQAAEQTTDGDMQAMKLGRVELQQQSDAAIDVKQPVEADVSVVSDNSLTKFGLALGAALVIAAIFSAASIAASKRRVAAAR